MTWLESPPGRLPPGALRALDGLLRHWGLGDRHAASCSLSVAGQAAAYRARRGPERPMRSLARAYLALEQRGPEDPAGATTPFMRARRAVRRARRAGVTRSPQASAHLALYVLEVAQVYAGATGTSSLQPFPEPERRRFGQFLLASLRLIEPGVTPPVATAVYDKVLGETPYAC